MNPTVGCIVHYHDEQLETLPAIVLRTWDEPVAVDLLVHGIGSDQRAYCVPEGDEPGCWSWPPIVPAAAPAEPVDAPAGGLPTNTSPFFPVQ